MAHSSDPSHREKTPGPHGSHSATRNLLRKKEQRQHGIRSSSPMGRVILINSPVDGGDDSEDLHTITVDKSVDGRLGFSVRGGSEHGLSIFVSKVEDNSTAEEAGLLVGDKLVEVNGISLESITMSSAVKVLTGNNRLRMVVRRVGKVPGIRYSKEKTTWVDLIHRRMVVEESGRTPSETSAGSALQRIVHLYTTSDDYCLGFNIRGGKEFGLGIYVSKLDPGGLAEQNGIKMGDQILAANGVSFQDISHSSAVEVLKSHTHIMLTIKFLNSLWLVSTNHPIRAAAQGTCLCGKVDSWRAVVLSLACQRLGFALRKTARPCALFTRLLDQEAGRYPAYKEMVAEYRWLKKLANGSQKSSSQGSDSTSSASSLSSGTPVSSLSGLSQVMFPPSLAFGSDMVDVCISTEDQRSESERTETAIQTDLPAQKTGADTTRSLGPTTLLRDSVIRVGEDGKRKESPKTAVLLALSRPSRPISRTRSQVTMAEIEQQKEKKQQQKKKDPEEKSTLQRSKTFVNLLVRGGRKKDTSRARSKSPSATSGKEPQKVATPDSEMLSVVEDMARRLLGEEEVAAVMKMCRLYMAEGSVENLIRHLLVILDRPEKLLLLREIRMLLPPSDLRDFNNMVTAIEVEAYDILKYRSVRSPPLRSPTSGRAPRRRLITPIPDYNGGFELQRAEEVEKESHLLGKLEKLSLPGSKESEDRPHSSRFFTPLLDIPLDAQGNDSRDFRSPSSSRTILPNWLLAGNAALQPPLRTDIDTVRSVHFDEASLRSSHRGRSALRPSLSRRATEKSVNGVKGGLFALQNAARRSRPSVLQVFSVGSGQQEVSEQANGHQPAPENNGPNGSVLQEYRLETVSISKTKQSLGISISGGMESKVQPMVKIEKIFPGGAASTCEVLKAGFELLSVDGISLQGVTHQHAVDIIRKAFSNKAKDPMVLMVKVPKGPAADRAS